VIWNSISHLSGAKMELAHRHSAFAASGVIKEEDHGTYMKFLQWDTKVLRFATCGYIACLIYVSVCALYTCTYIQMHISLPLLLVLVYVRQAVYVWVYVYIGYTYAGYTHTYIYIYMYIHIDMMYRY